MICLAAAASSADPYGETPNGWRRRASQRIVNLAALFDSSRSHEACRHGADEADFAQFYARAPDPKRTSCFPPQMPAVSCARLLPVIGPAPREARRAVRRTACGTMPRSSWGRKVKAGSMNSRPPSTSCPTTLEPCPLQERFAIGSRSGAPVFPAGPPHGPHSTRGSRVAGLGPVPPVRASSWAASRPDAKQVQARMRPGFRIPGVHYEQPEFRAGTV
jgi:hypothetical protein